jgi:hypothetical protein
MVASITRIQSVLKHRYINSLLDIPEELLHLGFQKASAICIGTTFPAHSIICLFTLRVGFEVLTAVTTTLASSEL